MLFSIDSFQEITASLSKNRGRTFLTGFGVFWGLFMLLFMLGGGKGLTASIISNFDGIAHTSTFVFTNSTTIPYKGFDTNRYWELNLDDVENLRREIPELDAICPILITNYKPTAEYNGHYFVAGIRGVTPDYTKVEEVKIKYGRYINEMDVKLGRKVCVLGKEVYENLFPEGGDPCGKFVKGGPLYCQVVGVDFSTSQVVGLGGRAYESMAIPISLMAQLDNRGNSVDVIALSSKDGVMDETRLEKIREIIARPHMIHPQDRMALTAQNVGDFFNLYKVITDGINLLIWLVGLGTLIAGIIGVTNIMMITVKERTVEIGIRRAIGATQRQVLAQILLESVTLTLMAGMLAIIFTVGVLYVMDMSQAQAGSSVSYQLDFTTVVVSALLLTLLGVAAGITPALRAIHIKPVDAMRDE